MLPMYAVPSGQSRDDLVETDEFGVSMEFAVLCSRVEKVGDWVPMVVGQRGGSALVTDVLGVCESGYGGVTSVACITVLGVET